METGAGSSGGKMPRGRARGAERTSGWRRQGAGLPLSLLLHQEWANVVTSRLVVLGMGAVTAPSWQEHTP